MKNLMMMCCVVMVAWSARAESVSTNGYTWTYSVVDGKATITTIAPAPTGDMVVPSELGGLRVMSIGTSAFYGCSGLTSVTIPYGVTSIGNSAFSNCCNMAYVAFPDSLSSIGDWAFCECRGLTSVTIPTSVGSIGEGAFGGCASLTNMVLPFVGASRAKPVYAGTNWVKEHFGYIFGTRSYDGCLKMSYKGYYIPQSLRTVHVTDSSAMWGTTGYYSSHGYSGQLFWDISTYGSFYKCSFLTEITLPENLTAIKDYAFGRCSGLSRIVLPATVNSIDEYAFSNCSGLMDVIFLGNAPATSEQAFTNANESCVAHVYYGSTGWGVSIPGTWKGLRIEYIIGTVAFDATGGFVSEDSRIVRMRDAIGELPVPVRENYRFLGWFTAAVDGTEVEASHILSDNMTLYAHWEPAVANLVIATSDNALFSNVFQTLTITCGTSGATILYTTDGSDPAVNGNVYKEPFSVYESCTVRAIARKEGLVDSEEASITVTRAEGLSEAANLYGYLMETDETHPWTVVTDVSHDGVSCVKSGVIGNGGMTWLQTSLKKAGTVSFWWKAACEDADVEDGETYYYDYGVFLVDDVEKAWIAGHNTGWRKVVVDVPSGGKHVLRWEYRKDGATSYAPDCVWLDQVQWIPADGGGYTLTTPEPVPYAWLSGYGLGIDSDFEMVAKGATGKRGGDGRALQVWQDYVAGTDPTNAASVFTAGIEFVDGVPQVTWSPNLNTNGVVRSYTIWGKESLTDAAWHSPTNAADRFFKVMVEMP